MTEQYGSLLDYHYDRQLSATIASPEARRSARPGSSKQVTGLIPIGIAADS
ncbi:hypothetical protein AM571_PA00306 (plasmid) [Rhizobium etli 8C-3]|uniref:Uncharacterized protein n=1 Tax=Rhizobium etli 8C-3 TaxID=538025 RepID=A0A1L5PAK1_RHIET|nr:hypothetical protein AM571_PA00306 [Rhizobium etli 8C-3]